MNARLVAVGRWLLVGGGLTGALIVIRPGSGLFGWAALLPIAGSMAYASFQVLTRKLASLESPFTTHFYTGLTGSLIVALALLASAPVQKERAIRSSFNPTLPALHGGTLGALLEAVAQVMQGEVYLSRQVAQKLALINLQLKSNPLQGLSSRELAILELLGAGRSLAEIAGRLQVSYRTVANITAQLRKKLQVPTTAALIRLAVEHHPQRLQPEAEM